MPMPMHRHPELRERECQKGADGEQRHQPVGDAVKQCQQQPGGNGQPQNTNRIDESAAGHGEGAWQIRVMRRDPTELRKGDKARIGGKTENSEQSSDCDEIDDPAPRDSRRQLR